MTDESSIRPREGRHAHLHFLRGREKGQRRLGACVAITLAAMAVECVAGILAGSLALVSDAGHMLTHGFSLIVSYFAVAVARRPATDRRTFGLYRVEILAALFNGATLLVITGFIVWFAVKRLIDPVPVAGGWMLAVAVVGLGVNVATTLILRESARDDLNVQSAFVHMLGDLFSSVVVSGGALVIILTGWNWIDPLLSVLVCALILAWAYRLIRQSVEILLQSTPEGVDIPAIAERLSRVEGVRRVHDVHVWTITSGLHSMSGHIEIDDMPISRSTAILDAAGKILKSEFGIIHYTIQIECGECRHKMEH
ncbi:MAG: cation transporter [Candidatus Aureabacteria bacterium]|nr:cation transporter [Candidatus Auribacterota bacterium]NLW94533.1 cation transporter [Chlamydiota bacterium]HOE26415.1 cation diffusion facilitator family transporter [bacterium]HQM53121.1 cation diffusion facilitator family transporter [bacterium]